MPSSKNRVIVACAGSGKTTRIVTESLARGSGRVAIITYTNNNAREICNRFGEINSGVPKHIDVMTWFGFLLRECARPYQRSKYAEKRIESLLFVNNKSEMYVKESDTKRYYFADGELIYSDKIARFVVECQKCSSGSVTRRLAQIYTDVFIDEFQDLAGWDWDVIEMLLSSGICVTLVGDPRQCIYSTNRSPKNKKYFGSGINDLVRTWTGRKLCVPDYMNGTYRCNQEICEFANRLWEGSDVMESLRSSASVHDGVFLIPEEAVEPYIKCFNPQLLRYDKNSKSYGREALNFGMAKGLQFDRVLIVPTSSIGTYLKTGDLKHVEKIKSKLHVAVTRARHSVGFVYNGTSQIVPARWTNEAFS